MFQLISKHAIRHSFSFGVSALFGMVALLQTTTADAGSPRSNAYFTRTLHEADTSVFLLGAREPAGPSSDPQLIAVDADGTVLLMNAGDPENVVQPLPVTVEPIAPFAMASRPTLATGNVLEAQPGEEVAINTQELVELLYQTKSGTWQNETAYDGTKSLGKLWGARLGDIDPDRPGVEPFVLAEDGAFDVGQGYFAFTQNKTWSSEMVYGAEVGMDSAIGETNPKSPGNEIIVGTEMGPVYEILPQPDEKNKGPNKWPKQTLWNDFENAPWVVTIADVLPEQPGNEIVYGTRYNNRVLLSHPSKSGDGHKVELLFTGNNDTDPRNMWDIAVGDMVPESDTLEIAAVDGTGSVYLVQHTGEKWTGETLFQDSNGALYAVLAMDFLPDRPGREIIAAGESGTIVLLARCAASAGDLNCDGAIAVNDLLNMLNEWGPCHNSDCPADLDNNNTVDVNDLLTLLNNWS